MSNKSQNTYFWIDSFYLIVFIPKSKQEASTSPSFTNQIRSFSWFYITKEIMSPSAKSYYYNEWVGKYTSLHFLYGNWNSWALMKLTRIHIANIVFSWNRYWIKCYRQKYSRLRCLLHVKGLVIGFYLGWSGHTLLIRKI